MLSAELESCTAPVPETLITTHALRLLDDVGRAVGGLPADFTLVKACKQEHAIEQFPTVRLSRFGFFREDRSSLVWDMQEGVVTSEPRIEDWLDFPEGIAIRMGAEGTTETFLVYGANCLIYCTAIEPRTSREWTRLEASFQKEGYDHYSPIRQPDMFAKGLGLMAFQQKGLLGDNVEMVLYENGPSITCRNLPVVHGPVAYVEDRNEYIRQSSHITEFILRCIFAKTLGSDDQNRYQDQREYRFAIPTATALDCDTLDLAISADMRQAMKQPDHSSNPTGSLHLSVDLSEWPSLQAIAPIGNRILSPQLHGNFIMTGIRYEIKTTPL